MTDPSSGGPYDPWSQRQQPFPPTGGYTPPPGYPPIYGDPSAPYGRDPVSGQPYSDKSKVTAGLLQLIGLVGIFGIGRIYTGQVGLGIAQLIIGLVLASVVSLLTCGLGYLALVIWTIVDAAVILTGRARDPMGRLLRG